MIIDSIKDTVTFESADVAKLSETQQKVLFAYVGERTTPEQFISEIINAALRDARKAFGNVQVKDFEELSIALATASPTEMAQAKAFLQQAKDVLRVQAQPAKLQAFKK